MTAINVYGLARRALSTSTPSALSASARGRSVMLPRDSISPPVHLDPAFNASREKAMARFDQEGFDWRGRIEWPVQWGDGDMAMHTNNVQYVRFLEMSRFRFIESLKPFLVEPGSEAEKAWVLPNNLGEGFGFILKEQTLKYRIPVTFPDSMIWASRPHSVDKDRGLFKVSTAAWSLMHQDYAVVCESTCVTYDFANTRKASMSDRFRAVLEAGSSSANL